MLRIKGRATARAKIVATLLTLLVASYMSSKPCVAVECNQDAGMWMPSAISEKYTDESGHDGVLHTCRDAFEENHKLNKCLQWALPTGVGFYSYCAKSIAENGMRNAGSKPSPSHPKVSTLGPDDDPDDDKPDPRPKAPRAQAPEKGPTQQEVVFFLKRKIPEAMVNGLSYHPRNANRTGSMGSHFSVRRTMRDTSVSFDFNASVISISIEASVDDVDPLNYSYNGGSSSKTFTFDVRDVLWYAGTSVSTVYDDGSPVVGLKIACVSGSCIHVKYNFQEGGSYASSYTGENRDQYLILYMKDEVLRAKIYNALRFLQKTVAARHDPF